VTTLGRAPAGLEHVDALADALGRVRAHVPTVETWGAALADRMLTGARLFVGGNGGSAAQAQHLSAEIVGRYRDDRRPFSALALHGDASALTAITNDYGHSEGFARQLEAHARPGDVVVLMSTSGTSANVVAVAERARRCGVVSWAMTGRGPNPLVARCDDAVAVDSPHTATVQEVHLVLLHVLCAAFDRAVAAAAWTS
jgi:D-sedoheptulose 7-phosphate isomerase